MDKRGQERTRKAVCKGVCADVYLSGFVCVRMCVLKVKGVHVWECVMRGGVKEGLKRRWLGWLRWVEALEEVWVEAVGEVCGIFLPNPMLPASVPLRSTLGECLLQCTWEQSFVC